MTGGSDHQDSAPPPAAAESSFSAAARARRQRHRIDKVARAAEKASADEAAVAAPEPWIVPVLWATPLVLLLGLMAWLVWPAPHGTQVHDKVPVNAEFRPAPIPPPPETPPGDDAATHFPAPPGALPSERPWPLPVGPGPEAPPAP